MSGHSEWAQIKRQKGVTDSRRGQLFTKLGREITVAARQGGGDPDANFRLRLAVQRARDSNMPSETIDRAIKRGAGGSDGAELQEITYEGYGPGGTAIMVDVLTDNRNGPRPSSVRPSPVPVAILENPGRSRGNSRARE